MLTRKIEMETKMKACAIISTVDGVPLKLSIRQITTPVLVHLRTTSLTIRSVSF